MYRVLGFTVGVFVAMSLSATADQAVASATSTTSRSSVSRTPGRPAGAVPARIAGRAALSGTASTIVQGNVLNCTNGPQPNAAIRLRDARSGHIVATQVADATGLFSVRGVDPGSYIVEIMGSDQMVLAASQILNVNAGEAVSGIVKLPCRNGLLAGLFGPTAQSAAAVTAAAASAAVLAAAVTKYTSPQ
jgi:hypothetical protein